MSLIDKVYRLSVRLKALLRYIQNRIKSLAPYLWSWVCREVFVDAWGYYTAEKKIRKIIEKEYNTEEVEEKIKKYSDVSNKLSDKRVKHHEDVLSNRRESIRDKAENNILGVTIAVSILYAGAILGSGTSQSLDSISVGGYISILFSFVSLLYFLFGGWYAFDAMRIGKLYRISPEKEAKSSDEEVGARRLWCLDLNNKETIIRSNALDVSFTSIRNGIISLVLAILSTLSVVLGT